MFMLYDMVSHFPHLQLGVHEMNSAINKFHFRVMEKLD